MQLRTILTPAEVAALPAEDLSETWCVVFDVLRATSTITAALANGARRVYPVLSADEAQRLRRDVNPSALLGGERDGVKLPGFDLGNSPREYTEPVVRAREIITTTTNGTVALRACGSAAVAVAAALVNIDAVAQFLLGAVPLPRRVLMICAGTGKGFALEDAIGAGALATRLNHSTGLTADDATGAAIVLYKTSRAGLPPALATSTNGRRLAEIGLGEDVAWCARESVIGVVPTMRADALEAA